MAQLRASSPFQKSLWIVFRGLGLAASLACSSVLVACSDPTGDARHALETRGVAVDKASLNRSIRRADLEVMELLVRAGVHPPHSLRRAVLEGRCSAVAAMLDAGYPVDNVSATTALMSAQAHSSSECVEPLLRAGVAIDTRQQGVMRLTRRLLVYGDQALLRMAFRDGVSLDAVDLYGRSAVAEFTRLGELAAAVALAAAGADLDLGDHAGAPALHYALWKEDAALVAALLDAGADPRVRDRDGWDALAVAARTGSVPGVARLLTLDTDPNGVTRQGWAPLALAVFEGHDEVVDRLLEAGADPLAGLYPSTALGQAARACRADLLSTLLASAGRKRVDAATQERLRDHAAACDGPEMEVALAALLSEEAT